MVSGEERTDDKGKLCEIALERMTAPPSGSVGGGRVRSSLQPGHHPGPTWSRGRASFKPVTSRYGPFTVATVSTVILGGCSAERSSWGVETSAVELELSESPSVSIGAAEGVEHGLLHRVRDATRLTDGTLVIASEGTFDLRFFDPTGGHQRTVGREGDGPGEFRALRSVSVIRGDTVVAWDASSHRLSFFDARGDYQSSLPVDITAESLGLAGRSAPALPDAVHVLRDGTLIVQPLTPGWLLRVPVPPESGVYAADLPLLVLGRRGSITDRIGPLRGDPWFVTDDGMLQTLLFGQRLYVASGPTRLYAGQGRPWSYRVGVGGALDDSVVIGRRGVALTDEAWTASVEARPERSRSLYASMPRPDTVPAYFAMVVDTDDNVWLRQYEPYLGPEPRPSSWLAFDPEGDALWALTLPPRMEVLEIATDAIVVLIQDELGVERVEVYGFAPRAWLEHDQEGSV